MIAFKREGADALHILMSRFRIYFHPILNAEATRKSDASSIFGDQASINFSRKEILFLVKYDESLLLFNPRNHSYTYDGKRLLGVTTALSAISKGDAIVQWAANCAVDYARANLPVWPDDYPPCCTKEQAEQDLELIWLGAKAAWKAKRDEAALIGTTAHDWVERYLKGEDPDWPTDPHARRSAEAALEWIRSVQWETVAVEQRLYIPELAVAGTCDWFARINGRLAIVDWKTSKSLHSTYAYQLAAYLVASEGRFEEKLTDRWLVRIDKETGIVEPRFLPEETIEKDYRAFESAVHIYRREAEVKKEWLS